MKSNSEKYENNTITSKRRGHELLRIVGTAAVLCTGASVFSLTGCNTVEGAGEDVQAAGEAVEDAANGQ